MRSKEKSARLIYVRHGKTDFPTNRIYCDDVEDPALNDEGMEQARAAASLFAGVEIDAICASTSARTRMTAAEISAVTGVPVLTFPEIRERRFGVWDGLFFAEIEQRFPEEYQRWKQDQAGYVPEGGETIPDLWARTGRRVEEIVGAYLGKTVVVVSHVGPIRLCLSQALGMPFDAYRRINIDYCSLSRVDYGRSQANVMYTNYTARGRIL